MKNVIILNGIPNEEFSEYENYLIQFNNIAGDINYELLKLRDIDIRYCNGCWGCWVKTPGECVLKDEMHTVLKKIINSDLVLFVSPEVMGFVSSLLKKTLDRMIPLVHPYIGIYDGECHHKERYDKYPQMGLILIQNENTTSVDVEIINDIFRNLAIDMKTKLEFTTTTHINEEVIENEINSIDWIS